MSKSIPNPPARKPVEIPDYLDACRHELDILERALGGYILLTRAYDHLVNGVPEGERRAGIPQFKHAGSVDGVKVVECIPELHKAPPQAIPQVLSTFCSIHFVDMQEAINKLVTYAVELQSTIHAAQAGPPQPAAQPVPAPAPAPQPAPRPVVQEDEDEEYEEMPGPEDEDEVFEDEEPDPKPRRARRSQG